MRTILCVIAVLIGACCANAQTATVTIYNNGNVSTVGSVTGNGVNSNGSAAGQLSLAQGVAPTSIVANSVTLVAPTSVSSSGFQVVVPGSATNGLWRGTQAVSATATATEMGGVVQTLTVTSGSGYSSGPSCMITDPGGSGSGATCSTSINGSGQVSSVTVTAAGSNYNTGTPTVTFGAPGSGITATGIATASTSSPFGNCLDHANKW